MRTRKGTYDTPKRTPAARARARAPAQALKAADASSGKDTESPTSPSLDIDTSIGVKVAPSSMLLPMFVASIVVMKVVCAAAAIARIDEERDARRRVIDEVDLDFIGDVERFRLLPRSLRIVEKRWHKLTDVVKHRELQRAIKEELFRKAYGDDVVGSELDNFDPCEE